VLILDEPTAGVDVELRRQLWAYVRELNARGVTIVLTTHYLEEAQELCDTIAIVNHGEVVACEPTRPAAAPARHPGNVVITPEEPLAEAPALRSPASRASCAPTRRSFVVAYKTGQSSVEQVLAAVRAAGVAHPRPGDRGSRP
jgi:ABC-2 type transport system ATP-binding protein